MDEKHKKSLNRGLIEFINNLDVGDVLPYLMCKEIMSKNEYERLTSFNTTREKVINFILSLQTKGPDAFQYFKEALNQHTIYAHLVSKLDDYLQDYDDKEGGLTDIWQWVPMSNSQNHAIEYCKTLLDSELPFDGACEHFLTVGLLKREHIELMKELPERRRQWSFFMEYVKGKGVVAYDLLLEFLKISHPYLEKAIREAEKKMKEREERFQKLVTFTLKYEKTEDYPALPRQLNIILLGKTGSGKSSTGNTIVGKKDVFLEVSGSSSGTKTIQKEVVKVHNFEISLLDTPGLFDTSSTLSNKDILLEIMKTAQEFPQGVHVFLLVCRGDVRFTKEEIKTFDDIQEQFGEGLLKHCLLVMTHADNFLEGAKFQEHLKNNQGLYTLFQKASGKAIAVANKNPENSPICISEIRRQLIHAIVDIVNCNNGQPFSNSIFEATKKQLEKEHQRSILKEKIDELTFTNLIYNFPLSQIATAQELSTSDVDRIVSNLNDFERSLMSKNEVNEVVQLFFKDHMEFKNRLMENKTKDQDLVRNIKATHSDEGFPETILHYVLQCFQDLPDATLNKLKAGNDLSDDEIHTIINNSPFQKATNTKMKQSSLISKYIDVIVNAFKRQKERHELMEYIHSECNNVIQTYFISKSARERAEIIRTFIRKGYIPPDLHCRCLKVLPEKFKSDCSWDSTVERVLLRTLVDRMNTENSILLSIIQIMKDVSKGYLAGLIIMFPIAVAGNILVGMAGTFGIISAGAVWAAYAVRRSLFPIMK